MTSFRLHFLLLLMFGVTGNAQPQIGLVPFDCPNVPRAEFQFDLDRRTITLVLEETDPDTTALFHPLANLHLRNYKMDHFDKMLRYYGTNLKARGWSAFEKSANFHVYLLTQNQTVIGIFVIVKSGGEVYLINMDGQFAPKQVTELVGKLDQLGIEIPELHAFGTRSDAVLPSTLLRTPEGDPIHEVRIQTNQGITKTQIRKVLEKGPDELIAAMVTLRSRLPAVQTLTVRIHAEGVKRIATIIVTAGPDTVNPATSPMSQPGETAQPQTLPTRFRTAAGEPIHEIQIQGNQQINEAQIRTALENGPEDIEKAIGNLRDTLPYLSRVILEIKDDSTRRIATITITAPSDTVNALTDETVQRRIFTTQFWTAAGEPIHEVQIRGNRQITAQIQTTLENGPKDIEKAIESLGNTLPNLSQVTLEIKDDGTKHVATIIVVTQSDTQSSPTIPTTRFRTAAGNPIHEIRIRGNQKITEAEIRGGLEYGPEDISKAVDTLKDVLPYFSRVALEYANDGTKRVAIITVAEKALSSDYYLGPAPLIRFNRVTGWLLAARLELGRRKEIGPFWMWNIPSSVRAYLPKLFTEVGYGFGNRHLNYRVGADAIRGKPDNWNLGVTAQIHRATTVVAPDFFPPYDSGLYVWYSVNGLTQLHNYYLREGVEVSFRWEPRVPTHSLKLTMRAESHESLQKTTDWHLFNWDSKPEARENPPINPGRLQSATFRYDLNTRQNSNLGWHNTLLVEHSSPAVGSDFDFTRFQLHLRYAVSKGKSIVRTRLMLGFATDALPIQRQFIIGGPGLLNGYPLYAFAGDHGALLNMEYLYRLSNLHHWGFLKEAFIVLSLNEGQVWNTSNKPYLFDPKADVGIGLQFWVDDPFVRMNFSKPLESGRGVQFVTTWFYRF